MTVDEILREWLAANGYEGLCTSGCGCESDNLAPCLAVFDTCVAGHKVPADPDDSAWGDDWIIVPGKKQEGAKKGGAR